MEKIKLPRAKSAKELINKKRKLFPFDGKYLDAFGSPEAGFVAIIWAKSFSGKTRFVVEWCKYLAEKIGSVVYNSLEEGDSETFSRALRDINMHDVTEFKTVSDLWPVFVQRILRKKSAQFAVVDSLQYTGITYEDYKALKEKIKKKGKCLIFISHSDGNHPEGKTAKRIRYDVDIKIQVIGFVAKVESRFKGRNIFVIWEKGAREYWGKKYNSVVTGKYWPGDKK